MPDIQENRSLRQLNTFGVEAHCRWFADIHAESDLQELFADPKWRDMNRLVLGGGSNMLFTKDFDGLVIRMNIPGITVQEDGDDVTVTAGAGIVWKTFVDYCVSHGYAGVENLSLIPGSVGASPIQNIGAYGVELKDVFRSCRVFDIHNRTFKELTKADCRFGYRDSIFKHEAKDRYIITSVVFGLSRSGHINTSYGAISSELEKRGISHPTIGDVSEVVSEIRVSKLPDPSTIGNAGSFFKNPVVDTGQFMLIQSAFPDIVHFSLPDGTEKLAAGWLIEKAGWKGRRVGETGTWKNQALVLVNHGNATGSDIYELSSAIIRDVEEKFGVTLEREVNII
jgi:UDP-N-acetylmuramate dehydrogenase